MKTIKNLFSILFLTGLALSIPNTVKAAPIGKNIEYPSVFEELLITLRAGTVVSLELVEELDLENLQAGNTIDFMVRSNVTVNGQVVISTGSIAEGWVKKIDRSCRGTCVKITITVESVQAVDGQRIFLRSIPHIFQSQPREAAVLPITTKLSARVLNDAKINA